MFLTFLQDVVVLSLHLSTYAILSFTNICSSYLHMQFINVIIQKLKHTKFEKHFFFGNILHYSTHHTNYQRTTVLFFIESLIVF